MVKDGSFNNETAAKKRPGTRKLHHPPPAEHVAIISTAHNPNKCVGCGGPRGRDGYPVCPTCSQKNRK